MIFALPNSCVLSLLATFVFVAFSFSLVSGLPVSQPPEGIEYKRYCSTNLGDTINSVCKGKTKSLADAFPESIGKRSKRFSPDETYFRPLSNGPIHMCCLRPCGYKELSEYCAEDEPTRSSDDP
ncbi:hypothetical protein ACLKA6_007171 [Drosophila palustris]